jgi:hypothetical protein
MLRMCVYMHSRFVESHPIRILEDGPSFLRWFYRMDDDVGRLDFRITWKVYAAGQNDLGELKADIVENHEAVTGRSQVETRVDPTSEARTAIWDKLLLRQRQQEVPAAGIHCGEDAGPVGPIPKTDEEPDWDGENGLTLYGAQPHLLLAMKPLHMLFARPRQCGLLNKLSKGCDKFRVSLYADDVAVFIRTDAKEVLVTEHILDMFASASGLVTNLVKTEFFPIRCEGINLHFLSQNNRHTTNFPCLYLGLPLTTKSHLKLCYTSWFRILVIDCQDGKENSSPIQEDNC